MNNSFLILSVGAVLFLEGCATHGGDCRIEPYPIELSPLHRTSEGLRLVSISNSRKVTLRLSDGRIAYARPGKPFMLNDGSSAPGSYTLLSADPQTGRVVVEGINFAMYEE
jgi:hypothetical protein